MARICAWITGIAGQDGSYLAELLLRQAGVDQIHGTVRPPLDRDFPNLTSIRADDRLVLHAVDLSQDSCLATIRQLWRDDPPDEVYHLAAQSHAGLSFEAPAEALKLNAWLTAGLLELCRDRHLPQSPRFLHASSSEIFGRPEIRPQTEDSPIAPVTPYGIAKAAATSLTQLYRQTHGMHAVNAICYNHESPRRPATFVTRKITRAAAETALGIRQELALGNLDAQRDWGDARAFVDGMWRMLRPGAEPEDYVLATGQLHTVRDVVRLAFGCFGLHGEDYVTVDPAFFRPAEPQRLLGDSTKAQQKLGWSAGPGFHALIGEMALADYHSLKAP